MRLPVFALVWLAWATSGSADSTGRTAAPSLEQSFWVLREPAPAQTQPSPSTAPSEGPGDTLMLANALLARHIEPAASRWLLGLHAPGDGEQVLDVVQRARALLAESRADAPRASESPGDVRETDIETLIALARAIGDVFAAGENEADQVERDAAAIELAVLLEDDRPEVANAARLWRAALFRRLGRHDRVLALLPDPLVGVSAETPRLDFYSRLLRTRSIADRGGYAAACTLLLEIEDKCDEWFPDPGQAGDARRATLAVRCAILHQWADSLDATAQSQEHAWCRRAIERARATACPDADVCPVLSLGTAVPLLVPLPAGQTTAPDDP